MKNEIKNEEAQKAINDAIKEISNWCVDNHSDDFSCEYQFTGYVNWVQVKIVSSADASNPLEPEYVSTTSEDHSLSWLTVLLEEMKSFKCWHDEEFKPENVAKKLLEKKQRRAVRLSAELEALNSELSGLNN